MFVHWMMRGQDLRGWRRQKCISLDLRIDSVSNGANSEQYVWFGKRTELAGMTLRIKCLSQMLGSKAHRVSPKIENVIGRSA
jgi:hypothetical protein